MGWDPSICMLSIYETIQGNGNEPYSDQITIELLNEYTNSTQTNPQSILYRIDGSSLYIYMNGFLLGSLDYKSKDCVEVITPTIYYRNTCGFPRVCYRPYECWFKESEDQVVELFKFWSGDETDSLFVRNIAVSYFT